MRISDWSSDVCSSDLEHCFYHLEAPIERVAGWDTPYPHAHEWAYFPSPARLASALRRVMDESSDALPFDDGKPGKRSEEHTSQLQSLMRISYAAFCLKKKHQYTFISHSNTSHYAK